MLFAVMVGASSWPCLYTFSCLERDPFVRCISRFRSGLIGLTVLLCFWSAASAEPLPGSGADSGKIVVYRDTWGVPHIYASTVEGGMFAMGWAQAQDRPVQLLRNLARGMGEISRADGESGIESDIVAKTFRLYESSQERLNRLDRDALARTEAFVNGINAWYAAHPEDVPDWWGDREVNVAMIVAFGRLFLHGWSIDDGFGDLKRGGIEPGVDETPRASNQWAIAPSRTADGHAILYIDPHLSWFGPSRFWEFRIHAGDLHGSGFTLAGQNFIGLGHNENLAWAMTTGGPDTADIYELTLNPDNPLQYRYDDEWRTLSQREIVIHVRGRDEPIRQAVYESHHGPIVALRNGKAYAHRMAYADQVEGVEAWNHLNFAKDYTGAVDAMATLQVFPQNVMVADTSGNIYYQRTGRVPRRPDGYDFSRPVDGSTSKTEWLGFHPSSDHPQILNPPTGYMQNCNISPDRMLPNCPLRADDFPAYLFTDRGYGSQKGGWLNQRGSRALELLASDDSVTIDKALEWAVDVQPYGADRWMTVLKIAHEQFGDSFRNDAGYQAAIRDLLAWDCRLTRDSTAALKYVYWRQQLEMDYGRDVVDEADAVITDLQRAVGAPPQPLDFDESQLQAALSSLSGAMARLKKHWGSWDVPYGRKFRVGRDDQSWPVGGGGDFGTRTLRSMSYEKEREDHTRWGRGGQTSTQIVVLSRPVQSWTFVPIGQSDRADSPHYRDQAEQLFSPRQLKPTWWLPQDLAGHIETRTVLDVPEK